MRSVGAAACRARALASALLILAASGCGQSPADALADARGRVASQDHAAALILLKGVIQQNPASAEARWLLGSELLASGDVRAAEIELRRALGLHQPEAQVVPLLARALLASGQTRKLVDEYAGLAWPDAAATAALKTTLAEAQATLGDLASARASLDAALQMQPGDGAALLLQARVMAVAGDGSAALRQVDGLLARQPGNADAWLLKGDLLARQSTAAAGAPGEAGALAAWRQALTLRPADPAAHEALIGLHLARQDGPAAQAQFEAMKKALPKHPRTRLFEAQLAVLQGDLPQARALFQPLLALAPGDVGLLQSAAAVELRLKAPAQAEALLVKALQLAPGLAPGAATSAATSAAASAAITRRLLAQAHLAQGQPARAFAVLAPLLGPASADAQALTLAAQARLLDGNPRAAAALFERAARARPDDARLRTVVALSHLASPLRGQADAAMAELQALAAGDAGSSADLALISMLLRRNDSAAALRAISALDQKQPGQALAPHLRGQVMLVQQDRAAARAAFEQAVQRDPAYFPSVAALAGLDFLDRQPDAARARLEALLKIRPGDGAARLALADLAQQSGAPPDAVTALLDQAVAASPDDATPRLALIDHHLASLNPAAALLAAQAALAHFPGPSDQAALLDRLGRAQLAVGGHQQAITTYNRLITVQPRSPAGLLGLAEAQWQADDLPAAGKSLKRALALAPDSLAAHALAIRLALRQQPPAQAQALALAREVQKQHPDQAVGYLLEAEIHSARQRWAAALPVLHKALALADPAQAPARYHHTLRRAGQQAEADAFASAWRKDHDSDALFLFYLGDLALAQNDLAGAEALYRAVLQRQPSQAMALNNIAWLLLAQKKPGAMVYAQRAVAAAPNQPALLDTLAQAHAAEQQIGQAIRLQKQALALRPDDPALRLTLARFYRQAGEKRLAKAELDRLQALGERFAGQAEVAALLQGLGGR